MNLGTFKLGAIMAAVFAVGVGGAYFGIQQTDEHNATLSSTSGMMMGHVTATGVDKDGNIFAYRQSDNAIVEIGMDFIASQLFEGVNATSTKAGLGNGVNPIDAIGIGTDGTQVTSQDTGIVENAACANQTVAWSLGTVNGTGSFSLGGIAMVGINGSATFGPSAACGAPTTYFEAGAFDDDTSRTMFARNTYNSVTLGAADSLIINWNFQFNDS